MTSQPVYKEVPQEGNELVSTAPGPDGKPLRYAIEEGIPVLLPASAAPADDTEN